VNAFSWRVGLALAVLPLGLFARSASEVFALASSSVVVVYTADSEFQPLSQGSGVAMPGQAVATNCHVLAKAAWIVVRDRDEPRPASLLQADTEHDVCLLRAPGLTAPPAQLGSSASLSVGDPVYAIGTPRGLELTLSAGIVSSFRGQGRARLIQTTAPISPGSSGGGLFDAEGRLVGLPSFLLRESQQLNFAVPVEWVKANLPDTPAPPPPSTPPTRAAPAPAAKPKPKPSLRAPATAATAPPVDHSPRGVARALAEQEDWPALLQHAQSWTAQAPNEAMAWYVLGAAYYHTGQKGLTTDIYTRLKGLDADLAERFFKNFVLP